jgi:hypothetical protein
MTAALAEVTIGGAALVVVEHNGRGWVSVRRACDALGINADGQRVKLKAQPWATTEMISVIDPAGMPRPAFFIDAESFPMWMATIDIARVGPNAAKVLLAFQCEAKRVLAEHFGVASRTAMSTARPSGGDGGSGGIVPRDDLDLFEGLIAAIRKDRAEIAAVRAEVESTRALVANVVARNADVAAAADLIMRKSTTFRESARAIKAAVAHVSRRIKADAPYTISGDWQTIFRACRKELGLARDSALSTTPTTSGAPPTRRRAKPIGECIKRADQVLTYARVATAHGVGGCDVRTINRILNSDDDTNTLDMPTEQMQ